jgi:hypothetical protein
MHGKDYAAKKENEKKYFSKIENGHWEIQKNFHNKNTGLILHGISIGNQPEILPLLIRSTNKTKTIPPV